MNRAFVRGCAAGLTAIAPLLFVSSVAFAQAAPQNDGVAIGDWTFHPTLEVRVRGEGRTNPIDRGGIAYRGTGVWSESYGSTQPDAIAVDPSVSSELSIGERSRLGLSVDHGGTANATFTLQDARVYRHGGQARFSPAPPSQLTPLDAYIDVHTRGGRKLFFRIGRQRLAYGEGRLIGQDDWSPTARTFDAARFGFQVGDLDVETFGALLTPPTSTGSQLGSGAQLYGLDAVYHLFPLLNIEALGLARVVRDPVERADLAPSDTFVIDGRFYGDRRGFRYAIEGAYELGRVASYGVNRDVGAFALSARAGLETALPLHLAFGVDAAYASGDNGDPNAKQQRFDPIFADSRGLDANGRSGPGGLSPLGAMAWSNALVVGANVTARPVEDLDVFLGYRLLNLADAHGRWTSSALLPVGAVGSNESTSLGNEIDATVRLNIWKPVTFEAGYGLFLFGDAAKTILAKVGRGESDLQHYAYFQTRVSL